MSDPLTDLIYDVQHNGLRWVSFVTAANYIYNEFRKYKLDKRDEAMFHNIKILIEERGKGEWFAENPNSKRNMERRLLAFGLTTISHVLPVKLSIHRKETDPLISRRKKRMILASISKKLTALILALGVATLNKKLGLDLSVPEVVTYIISTLGYILIQGHVDGKKAAAVNTVINTLQAAANDPIAYDPNITHQDVIKMANLSISTFNDMLKALKMNDNSAAYKTSATYFAEWKQVTDRYTPIVPLPAITEQKVSA